MCEKSWFIREIGHIIESPDTPVIVKLRSTDELETTITFNIDGLPHSFDDKEAVIRSDGTREWYTNGKLDRPKGPSVIIPYDTQIIPPINPDSMTERERNILQKISLDIRPDTERHETRKFFNKGVLDDIEDGPAVQYPDGGFEHYKNGQLHYRNGPTVKYSDGTVEYWVKGQLHRRNGYARILPDGTKYSYINGKLQSIKDKPSIKHANGDREWHNDGLLDRDGDLPAVEGFDGRLEYYSKGLLHRKKNPAKIVPGVGVYYYYKGVLHNRKGPAIVLENGRVEYYYHGRLDRDKEPALCTPEGLKEYYSMGFLNSYNDLPSVTLPDGTKMWHQSGKLHRVGAPAVIKPDGSEEWHFYGKLQNLGEKIIKQKDIKLSTNSENLKPRLIPKILSSECLTPKKAKPHRPLSGLHYVDK